MNTQNKLHKVARELKNALMFYMAHPEETWIEAYISMYKAYYIKLKKIKTKEIESV